MVIKLQVDDISRHIRAKACVAAGSHQSGGWRQDFKSAKTSTAILLYKDVLAKASMQGVGKRTFHWQDSHTLEFNPVSSTINSYL
ncbi:hypothetical protein [Pseudomonas cichorii]|uniref:hypothetical protein n=1 Tax=Pseudomonas cichorii TaxID=36746 RepID=UPI00191014F4|nr:hypothetical protein [Pseudomonas cichorii]